MTEIAQSIELNLPEKLQNQEYRQKFFLAEASADIARQLIALRKRRGLDQGQLAKLVGTQQPAISRIEKADYQNWSFNTLRKVAAAEDARIRITIEPAEDVLQEYETQSESVPVVTCNYDKVLNTLGTQSASLIGQFIPVTNFDFTNSPLITVPNFGFDHFAANLGRYSLLSHRHRAAINPSRRQDEKDQKIAELEAEVARLREVLAGAKGEQNTRTSSPAARQLWNALQAAPIGIPTP